MSYLCRDGFQDSVESTLNICLLLHQEGRLKSYTGRWASTGEGGVHWLLGFKQRPGSMPILLTHHCHALDYFNAIETI